MFSRKPIKVTVPIKQTKTNVELKKQPKKSIVKAKPKPKINTFNVTANIVYYVSSAGDYRFEAVVRRPTISRVNNRPITTVRKVQPISITIKSKNQTLTPSELQNAQVLLTNKFTSDYEFDNYEDVYIDVRSISKPRVINIDKKANLKKVRMATSTEELKCVPKVFLSEYGIEIKNDEYNADEIIEICKQHTMSCYGIDLQSNIFSSYKNPSSNRKALIYTLSSGHMELVQDKKLRKMYLALSNATESKKKTATVVKKQSEFENNLLEDGNILALLNNSRYYDIGNTIDIDRIKSELIDFDEFPYHEELTHYYIPDDCLLDNLKWYIVICEGIIPALYESTNGISTITWKSKNVILHHTEHIDDCLKICDMLDIKYSNQSISLLSNIIADEVLSKKNLFMESCHSHYHPSTYRLVTESTARPMYHNFVDIDDETEFTKKLVCYDIEKSYSTIAKSYELPVLDVNDVPYETDTFDTVHDWYVVEFKSEFHDELTLRFNDQRLLVGHVIVDCLDKIKITHILKPSFHTSLISDLINDITDKYGLNSKLVVNCIIGQLGKRSKKSSRPVYTYNLAEIGYYCTKNKSYASSIDIGDKVLYKTTCINEAANTIQSTRLPFMFILQLGRHSAYMLYKQLMSMKYFVPIRIKVDDVVGYFTKNIAKPTTGKIEIYGEKTSQLQHTVKYRKKDYVKTTQHKTVIKPLDANETHVPYSVHNLVNYNSRVIKEFNAEDEADLLSKLPGCLIDATGGKGKTYLANRLRNKLYELYGKNSVAIATFTGVASGLIEDCVTLHRLFQCKIKTVVHKVTDGFDEPCDPDFYEDETYDPDELDDDQYIEQIIDSGFYPTQSRIETLSKLSALIIDEHSMVPMKIWRYIIDLKTLNPKLAIYVFGDYHQIPPVRDEPLTIDSVSMRAVVNGHKLELTHNYRSSGDYADRIIADPTNFSNTSFVEKIHKFNLCFTNRSVNLINAHIKKHKLYPNKDEQDAYIIFTSRYKNIPKNMLAVVKTELVRVDDDADIESVFNTTYDDIKDIEDEGRDFRPELLDETTVEDYDQQDADFDLASEPDEHSQIDDFVETYIVKQLFVEKPKVAHYTYEEFNKLPIQEAYAITYHKSQSITVNEPYNMYEVGHKKLPIQCLYVGRSRATDEKLVSHSYNEPSFNF